MVTTIKIDDSLTVTSPGYGGMGLSQSYGPTNDEEGKKVLRHAIEIGCTFWNTARIYGAEQHNEKLIGEVLREGNNREKVVIVTKWGLKPTGSAPVTDGMSPLFASRSSTTLSMAPLSSLNNASTNLSRTWALLPIFGFFTASTRMFPSKFQSRQWRTLARPRKAGKCKYIGLSAMSASTLRRASKVAKMDFIEMEYSPFETGIEADGKGMLTGRFRSFDDFKAGDSRAAGVFPRFDRENFEHNFKIVEALEKLAKEKGCTPGQLALAWDAQVHPGLIITIPGTKSVKYLDENWESRNIELSEADIAAVRKAIEDNPIKGEQYNAAMGALLDKD
ncbi:Aldo/keto reductase [Meredithblackwellia eburnea MCA 4105]